jgi:PTS system nitrogen regulatory IIA component
MASDDFDVDNLARYLHISPAQVVRMAERGKVPARRVGGQWKFSQAEIHHWLEERIGAAEDSDLANVEQFVRRAATEAPPTIAEMLPLESVAVPLAARTTASVIDAIVKLAANSGLLWDVPRMVEAVGARESLHPTALDNGVAFLHPRRPLPQILAEPLLALGRTTQGIPFGNARGQLTDVFFLICSVDDAGHLHTLARLSRLLALPDFLDNLRAAEGSQAVWEVVIAADTEVEDIPGTRS